MADHDGLANLAFAVLAILPSADACSEASEA